MDINNALHINYNRTTKFWTWTWKHNIFTANYFGYNSAYIYYKKINQKK